MNIYTAKELLRYSNHPLANVRTHCPKCKCQMIAPAYPGDYFDCTNTNCNVSIAPTQKQIEKMANGKLKYEQH
jgi:hypothetical protein